MKTCNTKTNNTISQLSGVRRIRRDRILENSTNLFPPNDADVSHKCFIDKHSFQVLCFFFTFVFIVTAIIKEDVALWPEMAVVAVNVIRCVISARQD